MSVNAGHQLYIIWSIYKGAENDVAQHLKSRGLNLQTPTSVAQSNTMKE